MKEHKSAFLITIIHENALAAAKWVDPTVDVCYGKFTFLNTEFYITATFQRDGAEKHIDTLYVNEKGDNTRHIARIITYQPIKRAKDETLYTTTSIYPLPILKALEEENDGTNR